MSSPENLFKMPQRGIYATTGSDLISALQGLTRPAGQSVRSSVRRGAKFLLDQRWRFNRILPSAFLSQPLDCQLAEIERRLANQVSLGREGHWAFCPSTTMALREGRLALRYLRRFEADRSTGTGKAKANAATDPASTALKLISEDPNIDPVFRSFFAGGRK